MKQVSKYYTKTTTFIALLLLSSIQYVFAQDKVEVNGHDVGSWFSNHWMWIAGGIVLLVLIILISSGGSSRRGSTKSTTIVKDSMGNVKSVTTTEKTI